MSSFLKNGIFFMGKGKKKSKLPIIQKNFFVIPSKKISGGKIKENNERNDTF